jgi:hypothetical protein
MLFGRIWSFKRASVFMHGLNYVVVSFIRACSFGEGRLYDVLRKFP